MLGGGGGGVVGGGGGGSFNPSGNVKRKVPFFHALPQWDANFYCKFKYCTIVNRTRKQEEEQLSDREFPDRGLKNFDYCKRETTCARPSHTWSDTPENLLTWREFHRAFLALQPSVKHTHVWSHGGVMVVSCKHKRSSEMHPFTGTLTMCTADKLIRISLTALHCVCSIQ